MPFEPHYLGTPEATIVYYTLGNPENPPLLFINGGPGDDHQYLRPVAEQYADSFYCVLYDQRGCGKSTVSAYNQATLNIDHFMADIDRIRRYLRADRLALWGHSWGAMLSLYFGAFYPEKIQSLTLVGMGPLNAEFQAVAGANFQKPLSAEERQGYAELREKRKAAFADENWEEHAAIHTEMMKRYTSKAWFYSPEKASRFVNEYIENYGYNPRVAPALMPSVKAIDIVSEVAGKDFPVQVVYGYQDFEPINQAYVLQAVLPACELCLINEAGHVVWYEQPDEFFTKTRNFLIRHIQRKTEQEIKSQ